MNPPTSSYDKCLFAYADSNGNLWLQSSDGGLRFPLPLPGSGANAVQKTGDTMTGPLDVVGSSSSISIQPDHIAMNNTGGVVMFDATGTMSVTLTIDDSTGDLIIYNTNRQRSINLSNGFVGSFNVTAPPQAPSSLGPSITSINPSSVSAGSSDTVITITGSGFTSSMKPGFGDHLMSWTTQMVNPVFVNNTTFEATLGANLLAYPTSFFIFLINSGGPDSNNLEFDVK